MATPAHPFRCLMAALIIALAVLPASAQAGVRVHLAGGYEEIDSYSEGETEYISLSELAEILGGGLDWETIGHQVTFEESAYHFSFLINSPFFKVNDSIFNMTYPATFRKGQLYLPAETFLPFLDQVDERRIWWVSDDKAVRIDSEYFNVTDISFSPKTNGLLIEIYLSAALPYDVLMSEGNWVNVSIRNAHLNRSRILSR